MSDVAVTDFHLLSWESSEVSIHEFMKLQHKLAFYCLLCSIWSQQITCDQVSNTSAIKWSCTCLSASEVSQRLVIAANCSKSCDCQPGRSSGNRWSCVCAHDEFPVLEADNHNSNCFTACDCTSGSLNDTQAPRKHISSKIVVIILLECVALMTFVFAALVICYVYRKGNSQQSKLLSDKGSSYNSTTNLISRRPTSVSESCIMDLPASTITGCFGKASLIFWSKTGKIRSTIVQFSYSELENATNRFRDSNLIGVGGSSHVYRGQLTDGRTVAVKRFTTLGGPDADSVFLTEIELISRLNHCHVVPLLGYCSESLGKQTERLLVFDFMANGNLRECLDGASGKYLDWNTRVTIALGAARGLEYLHEASAPRILHRDVKSTNILLDENWRPKITDLGMAKRISTDGFLSCSSSPARMQGTFGYFAPEYAIIGRASLKSDVFSFGVVLLELITGQKPIFSLGDKGEESLVIWAAPRLQDSRKVISELPDPHLEGQFLEEAMQIMAYLAKECLQLDPDSRPNMSEVVQILSTIAPKSSRRINTANLLQNLPNHGMNKDPDRGGLCNQVDAEELNRISSNRCSDRYSPPLDIDRIICLNENGKQADTSSAAHAVNSTRFTSNDKSCHAKYDEDIVDLMEPRLETFCMGNGSSS
ncbi:hypothetical protein Nepgr_008963 [Nepenthes gracilis]|uniref:non-specific serine/threonine protein kinase n=1 Tax=Nepenthes gracilis TaxID=150966 RepID=A0AAD3XJR2_NEPGR|nr:hypothetical protein Nepgr_008963 [Nepenthes gracilis]